VWPRGGVWRAKFDGKRGRGPSSSWFPDTPFPRPTKVWGPWVREHRAGEPRMISVENSHRRGNYR